MPSSGLLPNAQCLLPNAQCPMPSLPNAQCPMPSLPNAQCPMPNALCPTSTSLLRKAIYLRFYNFLPNFLPFCFNLR
jgi:hypothetical protein